MDTKEVIKTETEALLAKMIGTFEVLVEEEEDVFHVIIKADEDAPTIIGRHGETIRALQKILEVVLYKQTGKSVHVLVNVNDYREKQKERLEGIAEDIAQRIKSGEQEVSLRSFSSFERKLIHEYITNKHTDLTSYSVGEGRDRRLIISSKKEEKPVETIVE